MSAYIYLIGAIIVMAAIGAAGYKGYGMGEVAIKAEWQAATLKAKEESDAQAEAERTVARKTASDLQKTLSKERLLKNDLTNALQAHIRLSKPLPPGCPAPELDAGLFDLWQRSNAGPDGAPGGKLPDAGGTAAKPAKP